MFDLGWTEMMVIGIVALIVVGPKDLPGLFRSVGQFVGKAKGMAREFSSAMNAAADEAGVNEINKTIKAAANPKKFGVDKIREATQSSFKPGGETAQLKSQLSEERAANKAKIDAAMAKAAEDRMAKEAAEVSKGDPIAKEAAPKKTAATKVPVDAKTKPATKPKAKAKPAAKTSKKPAAKASAPKKSTAKAAPKASARKKTATAKSPAKDAE